MAVIREVYTLPLVAKKLGENEDWLWDISCEMDAGDGCLSVLGPNDEHTVAFTDEGIENLIELVRIHKADPSRLVRLPLDS